MIHYNQIWRELRALRDAFALFADNTDCALSGGEPNPAARLAHLRAAVRHLDALRDAAVVLKVLLEGRIAEMELDR